MKVLVTGAAGFIGFHTTKKLLSRGDQVVGLDNLNDYYDVTLKESRLAELTPLERFQFIRGDLADLASLRSLFQSERFDAVMHLAAQAGVRYSLVNPHAYIESNVAGFMNVLECVRHAGVGHLVYASSSSVYGANTGMPFSVQDNVDHPLSLYAATKKANELMAHSYSHLYRIPTTGLRFFTVYGPWGRPDMAMFLFTKAILAGEPIQLFNHGAMRRDFTYVDDIVEGVIRVIDRPAQPNRLWSGDKPDAGSSKAPYRLYNIGNNSPIELQYLVSVLEKALGKTARREYRELQPGDVLETCADVEALATDVGFTPATSIEDGVGRFVDWYLSFYDESGEEAFSAQTSGEQTLNV
jgi:UDP-glucuronate 4-epimerase